MRATRALKAGQEALYIYVDTKNVANRVNNNKSD